MSFKKKTEKVNIVQIVFVSLCLFSSLYVYSYAWDYNVLIEEKNELREESRDLDKQITNLPSYLQIKSHGNIVSTINELSNFKDASVRWFDFIQHVKKQVWKKISFTSFDPNIAKNTIHMTVFAPTQDMLLSNIDNIKEMKEFSDVSFTLIKKVEKTDKNTDEKYFVYEVVLEAQVNDNYLEDMYEQRSLLKKLQYENSETDNTFLLDDNSDNWETVLNTDADEILYSQDSVFSVNWGEYQAWTWAVQKGIE